MCIFVIAKEMTEHSDIYHLLHPELIFLNALTPWLLQMHQQCQSHCFEFSKMRSEEGGGFGDEGAY